MAAADADARSGRPPSDGFRRILPDMIGGPRPDGRLPVEPCPRGSRSEFHRADAVVEPSPAPPLRQSPIGCGRTVRHPGKSIRQHVPPMAGRVAAAYAGPGFPDATRVPSTRAAIFRNARSRARSGEPSSTRSSRNSSREPPCSRMSRDTAAPASRVRFNRPLQRLGRQPHRLADIFRGVGLVAERPTRLTSLPLADPAPPGHRTCLHIHHPSGPLWRPPSR